MCGRAAYMICRAFAGSVSLPLTLRYASSIICAATSLNETPRSCVMRAYRYDRETGLRSSAFLVLVHFLVPSRMAPMISAAMLLGRSDFFAIVILGNAVAFDNNRRLTAIGVRDARTGEMQRDDHRLRGVGANFSKDAVEAFATATELAERVVDAGRPVDAADDFAARPATGIAQAVAVNAERKLDDAGDAAGFAQGPLVGEGLRVATGQFQHTVKVLLADDAEIGGTDRLGMSLD